MRCEEVPLKIVLVKAREAQAGYVAKLRKDTYSSCCLMKRE